MPLDHSRCSSGVAMKTNAEIDWCHCHRDGHWEAHQWASTTAATPIATAVAAVELTHPESSMSIELRAAARRAHDDEGFRGEAVRSQSSINEKLLLSLLTAHVCGYTFAC